MAQNPQFIAYTEKTWNEVKNKEYSFLKVKLYIVSNIFIQGDTKPIDKESIMDFYNYLKEGTEMIFMFSIGKCTKLMESMDFRFMLTEFN